MWFFSNLVGEEGPRIPGVKGSRVCFLKTLSGPKGPPELVPHISLESIILLLFSIPSIPWPLAPLESSQNIFFPLGILLFFLYSQTEFV